MGKKKKKANIAVKIITAKIEGNILINLLKKKTKNDFFFFEKK